MKDRQTGEPRGFGFVDFEDIASADALLNLSDGIMKLRGQELFVEYSRNQGSAATKPASQFKDWICTNVCPTNSILLHDIYHLC